MCIGTTCTCRLHLPTPNRFIPTDLSLADDEAAAAGPHPEVVAGIPGRLRLWHKPDTRFRQPKAVLNLDVQVNCRLEVSEFLYATYPYDYLSSF